MWTEQNRSHRAKTINWKLNDKMEAIRNERQQMKSYRNQCGDSECIMVSLAMTSAILIVPNKNKSSSLH